MKLRLLAAALGGHVEAAEALLQGGANPNAAGQSGITPLIAAVVRGQTAMAELLIRSGRRRERAHQPGRNGADGGGEQPSGSHPSIARARRGDQRGGSKRAHRAARRGRHGTDGSGSAAFGIGSRRGAMHRQRLDGAEHRGSGRVHRNRRFSPVRGSLGSMHRTSRSKRNEELLPIPQFRAARAHQCQAEQFPERMFFAYWSHISVVHYHLSIGVARVCVR